MLPFVESMYRITFNNTDAQHHFKLRICDENIVGHPVQFRWLQTTEQFINNGSRDTWSLDDFEVTVTYDAGCTDKLVFSDNFEDTEDFPKYLIHQL